MRVLIVDDAVFMRSTLKKIFTNNGFEVVGEAANGEVAVQLYEELRPDIVTLDITMPVMSGIEALREIKKIDSKAKVVMVSAMGQQNIIIQCVQEGAKNFLVKPFDKEKVIAIMNDLR